MLEKMCSMHGRNMKIVCITGGTNGKKKCEYIVYTGTKRNGK
jgi:hypothetical protein